MAQNKRKYRVSDVVGDSFLRFPLILLANPLYKVMSLEAKFVYSLLLNRLSLSQKNGWVNEHSEVYLIYTREEVADTLNISYKKSISAFKELLRAGLLEETRQGRGYPNLLFVLKAEIEEDEAKEFADEFDYTADGEKASVKSEDYNSIPAVKYGRGTKRHANLAHQELPKPQVNICHPGSSCPAAAAHQDMSKRHTSKTENSQLNFNPTENSPSVGPARGQEKTPIHSLLDRQTDEEEELLQKIYTQGELDIFSESIQTMFKGAIDRLFYSKHLKIGDALLPQPKVRSYLQLLDGTVLSMVLDAMQRNETPVKNTTAYLMSSIINTIFEQQSDLVICLPPAYQTGGDYFADS